MNIIPTELGVLNTGANFILCSIEFLKTTFPFVEYVELEIEEDGLKEEEEQELFKLTPAARVTCPKIFLSGVHNLKLLNYTDSQRLVQFFS